MGAGWGPFVFIAFAAVEEVEVKRRGNYPWDLRGGKAFAQLSVGRRLKMEGCRPGMAFLLAAIPFFRCGVRRQKKVFSFMDGTVEWKQRPALTFGTIARKEIITISRPQLDLLERQSANDLKAERAICSVHPINDTHSPSFSINPLQGPPPPQTAFFRN